MLKFFRRIRKNLLSEGKIGKYLKYTVGEIILVVLGILIALQINNINEERKELTKSHEVLAEIKENLQFNTARFMAEIEEEKNVIKSVDIVLGYIDKSMVYNDSLDFHFINTTYWPTASRKASGYETLKSHGVELIKSSTLRQAIIDLYEKTYNEISNLSEESSSNHSSTVIPLFTELFQTHQSIPGQPFEKMGATPFNYDEVVNSKKFKGIISFWRHSRTIAIQLRQVAINKNSELIDAINKELEKK